MSIFGSLFGNNASTTTQTQMLAGPAANVATDLFNRTQAYANQPWQPYGGNTVAGLTPDQLRAFNATRDIAGTGGSIFNTLQNNILTDSANRQPWNDAVADLATRSGQAAISLGQQFPDADIGAYMSPYVDAVLQPALRDLTDAAANRRAQVNANSVRTGSFGGSRNALAQNAIDESMLQEAGRLSANERAAAFNNAAQQWRLDQQMLPAMFANAQGAFKNASDFQAMGYGPLTSLLSANQGRLGAEVNPLLATGAIEQTMNQAFLDRDLQNFLEARDWGGRGINALLASLGAGGGATGATTQSTVQGARPNAVGQVVGATSGILGSLGGISGIGNLASGAWNAISDWFAPTSWSGVSTDASGGLASLANSGDYTSWWQ